MHDAEYACEAEIVIPLDTPTLLMQEIAEKVAVATMIRDTPGMYWYTPGICMYYLYVCKCIYGMHVSNCGACLLTKAPPHVHQMHARHLVNFQPLHQHSKHSLAVHKRLPDPFITHTRKDETSAIMTLSKL